MFTSRTLMLSGAILLGVAAASFAQQKLADDVEIATYRPRFAPKNPEVAIETTVAVPVIKQSFTDTKSDITRQLNSTLDSVYAHNVKRKFAAGFRVLVYSGTDKLAMNEVKQKVYKQFPDIEVYTIFKQPEYRVSFGDFIDKLHAHNYLVKVRKQVPDALIVQEQINIR